MGLFFEKRLVMESVKTAKTNKVGKNTETADTKANKETHFKQVSHYKYDQINWWDFYKNCKES